MKGANPKQLEHYVQQQSGAQGEASGSSSSKKNFGIPGHVKDNNNKKKTIIYIFLLFSNRVI
jgi:hypothetical protein